MKELLAKVLSVAEEFIAWFWGKLDPPKRKPWCAIFYYVAQEDPTIKAPEPGLDPRLLVTVQGLTNTVFDDATIHVAYRTVWNETGKLPKAAVLNRPLTWATFFPGCSSSSSTPVLVGNDMGCFFKWVYKWCPADQYAIFFWGHSFGPAGLFEGGGPVVVPKPGPAGLKEAFQQFIAERAKDQSPAGPVAMPSAQGASGITSPSSPATSSSSEADAQALADLAAADPKVELVVFQDCWMSTLETAFELRDVAHYVVASQSLVPAGGTQPDFVWPYTGLLADLSFTQPLARATQMCSRLVDFYVNQIALGRVSNLTSVPWSVLDLSAVPTVIGPLTNLVHYLQQIAPVPANKAALITPANIHSFIGGSLAAGDPALVDFPKMCTLMAANGDATLAQRANALSNALASLIKVNDAAPRLNPDGFGGASALYRPPFHTMSFVVPALIDAVYQQSPLPQNTGWPALENP